MEIRDATEDDYDAYAHLFVELGVDDPVPERAWFAAEQVGRTIVATDGGEVIGYALYEVLADTGYVRNLVTDPRHRRRGVGRALMDELARRFRARGCTAWCLNVKPDNVAAIALYERCGMRVAYRAYTMRLPREAPPVDVPRDLEVRTVAPADDANVERAMGLLGGQLASARTRAAREVLGLYRGGALAGVAVFVTSVPGAFPFRVTDPALGPPFAQRLRERVPGAPFVQAVVEDDDALRDALAAAGAYVALAIEHMRGPLSAAAP